MNKPTILTMAASSLLLASAAAWACPPGGHGPMGGHGMGQMPGQHFKQMDTNGDGLVSKAEFDAYHEQRFKELDANRDGQVSAEEMDAHHKAKCQTQGGKGAMMDEHFDAADANHDGALTATEAEKMPMVSKNFKKFDANKDGKVTKEEMKDAFERMHRMPHPEPMTPPAK